MHGSSLIKVIGALFSAIFGIYGIGAQTRDEKGQLNRAGWISLVGLVVSMIVTVTGQYLEDWEHVINAQAEIQRYERLLSSAYCAALSTRGAKVDLGFSIAMEDLKAVESGYANRPEAIYQDPNRSGCTTKFLFDPEKAPGLRNAHSRARPCERWRAGRHRQREKAGCTGLTSNYDMTGGRQVFSRSRAGAYYEAHCSVLYGGFADFAGSLMTL